MPANGQQTASSQISTAATWIQNTASSVSNQVAAGVRTVNGAIASAAADTSAAPPNASAAPNGNTKYAFTGLCDAMNKFEQDAVKAGTAKYPNVYKIEFVTPALAASGITIPGTTDYKKTPNIQNGTAANKVNPNTNSVKMDAKIVSVQHGTQIIQFIEMVMRNSQYITNQATATIDQVTGNAIPKASANSTQPTTWFKISVNAVPIGNKIDPIRNDYPYQITYIISPYSINEAQSQYFPDARFRGVQKVYDYWFTGNNTQVIGYEQSYNNQYRNVLSSKDSAQAKIPGAVNNKQFGDVGLWMGPNKTMLAPTTGQSDQQADKGANNPASSLADYLYSFSDQANITLQIIGDPAWLVQGETKGITADTFQFTGFYADGTVNPDAQQVVFAVNFNAPADYNLKTGLVDVNASSTNGDSNNLSSAPTQASAAYTATEVKSVFSKGKFTQEIKGNALKNLNAQQLAAATGRAAPASTTLTPISRTPLTSDFLGGLASAAGTVWQSVTGAVQNAFNSATPVSGAPTQTAAAAGAPTSNGADVGTASPASSTAVPSTTTQVMAPSDDGSGYNGPNGESVGS